MFSDATKGSIIFVLLSQTGMAAINIDTAGTWIIWRRRAKNNEVLGPDTENNVARGHPGVRFGCKSLFYSSDSEIRDSFGLSRGMEYKSSGECSATQFRQAMAMGVESRRD